MADISRDFHRTDQRLSESSGPYVAMLGPLEVRRGGGDLVELGPPQRRVLLLRLLLENNRPVSAERLSEDVWEGRPPSAAGSSLHAHISRLRRALEPGRDPRKPPETLVSAMSGYRLRVSPERRDTVLFERGIVRAQELAADGRLRSAREEAERALRLWRGEPLAEAGGWHFAQREAVRLHELRRGAEDLRASLLLKEGAFAQAVAAAEELIAGSPLRETSWATLIRALYAAGRPAEALQRYATIQQLLADELGTDPGHELRRIHLAILRHDPGVLDVRPARRGAPVVVLRSAVAERRTAHGLPLTGRSSELSRLAELLTPTATDAVAWGVVSGDAGTGRTRLVDELAALARETGREVIHVRCAEGTPDAALTPVLRLLEGDRGRTDAAALCVVDDVHEADDCLHRALIGLLRMSPGAPLTVVCTTLTDSGPAAEPLLTALARRGAEHIRLGPLSLPHVQRLVETTAEHDEAAAVSRLEDHCAALHRLTGGNARFLTELLRLPPDRRTGPHALIPPSVAHLINRGVQALDDRARDVLQAAAVIGDVVDVPQLADVCRLWPRDVLHVLDAAVAAGLIVWVPGADPLRLGAYRFTSGLVRTVLLEALTPSRRYALHSAVSRSPDRRPGHDAEVTAAHAVAASPLLPAEEVAGAALRAPTGLPVRSDTPARSRPRSVCPCGTTDR
ncbi:BTAD domain-containing putative transcriptional regulator [Streptomyces sp.]|uniref:BTAD domain-containing putative transcriptional regulator n=1 Tax=Streptomyces sp. TaxID=1931 RepID=UPI002F3F2DBB